jgi:ParB-like nuclease domain/DNA methylase
MEVKEIPVNEIKVKDRARHEIGNLLGLQDSIQAKGLLQPITIDHDRNLLAGERRLQAHKNLGIEHILCVVRDNDDKVTKVEIEYDENIRRKNLTWQEQCRLEKKIFELRKERDPNWTIRKQFREEPDGPHIGTISERLQLAEAMETMPDLAERMSMDEAFKEMKRYEEDEARLTMELRKTKEFTEAPTWADEHYVVGDALNGMAAFLKTHPHSQGKAFQFAEVDPPYGVNLHKRKGRNSNDQSMEEYLEWEDYPKLFELTARLVFECMDPNAFAIFWYGMSRHHEALTILRSVGWYVPDIPAIWHKGEVGQTASPDTAFGSCYEPFFVARKGYPKLARPGRGNVFTYPGLQKKTHPTEKPIWLMEELLNVFCFPGSRILVPFLGSGVTLRAAYKLEHTGTGWDLSDKHKAGFLRRVKEDQAAADAANVAEVASANAI